MRMRNFGRTSLLVSPLCLGGNVFGWTADEAASFQVLDAFVEAGGNFIDTANVYRRKKPGQESFASEAILGRWMKQRSNRDWIILATKVGSEMSPDQKGLAKSYILKEVEDSLRRLQTDCIDLYISHRADPATPLEETLEAYALLLKQGKIRYCGASNHRAVVLKEAIATSQRTGAPAYQSLQPLYNLYDRGDFENYLRPVCESLGLAVTPYFSLAAGFLTGKYRQESDFAKSPRGAGMAKYLNPRGHQILKALDQVAAETGTSATTVALAWLMDQTGVTSAIASARSLEQMPHLLNATDLRLTADARKILDEASAELVLR